MSIFSNPILSGNYDNIAIKGKQYYVPWKSAVITKSDKVLARIELKEEGKPSGDTLKFVSTSGLPVVATRLNDTLYEVQVDGISSKGEFGILATYNYPDSTGKEITVTAGQANISAYAMQEMNLVLIPVNQSAGVLAKVTEDSINAIYSQAATNWSVSLEEQLDIDEVNTSSLDDGDAGLLSNYTDDMEAIIKAYSEKKAGNIDKNTCYLFLVEGAKSGSGKEGYMPLKNQYGFIFTGNCKKVEHTIAHELGHGPFRLYHTFSEHNEYMQTEGSTKNLMDYTKTKEKNLYKYQWDLIHDPESMIGLFQDEDEGAFDNYEYLVGRNVISGAFKEAVDMPAPTSFSFVANTGKVISLPLNVTDVTFHSIGTLMGFTVLEDGKQERYVSGEYKKGENAGKFAGFLKEFGSSDNINEKIYQDKLTKGLSSSSIKVYFALRGSEFSGKQCEMYLLEGDYPLTAENKKGEYNDAGNGESKLAKEAIRDKLSGSYENGDFVIPTYGSKLKYLANTENSYCLNECALEFYNERLNSGIISNSELLEIAYLVNDVGDILYEEYEDMAYKSQSDYEKFLFDLGGASKQEYSYFEEKLQGYLNFKRKLKAGIDRTAPENIIAFVELLTLGDLKLLSVDERVHLLTQFSKIPLSDHWFWGNGGESLTINLIKTASNKQSKELLTSIRDNEVLYELFNKMDDTWKKSNFTNFAVEITEHVFNFNKTLEISDLKATDKVFIYGGDNVTEHNYITSLTKSGRIKIHEDITELRITENSDIPEGKPKVSYEIIDQRDIDFDAFDLIAVYLARPCEYIPDSKKGDIYVMPALYFNSILKKELKDFRKDMLNTALFTASIYLGVAEVRAAKTLIEQIFKITTLGVSISNGILQTEGASSVVKELEGGKEFLIALNLTDNFFTFNTLYKRGLSKANNYTKFLSQNEDKLFRLLNSNTVGSIVSLSASCTVVIDFDNNNQIEK